MMQIYKLFLIVNKNEENIFEKNKKQNLSSAYDKKKYCLSQAPTAQLQSNPDLADLKSVSFFGLNCDFYDIRIYLILELETETAIVELLGFGVFIST